MPQFFIGLLSSKVCSYVFPDIPYSDPDSDSSDDSYDNSIGGPSYSLITDVELSYRELSDNEMGESIGDNYYN